MRFYDARLWRADATRNLGTRSVAAQIVGKSAADDHRTQELTAFGDFCQSLVTLKGIRVDISRRVQRFAFVEDLVRPCRKLRKFILKKLERLMIRVRRGGYGGLHQVGFDAVVIIVRPSSHHRYSRRDYGADRASPLPHFSQRVHSDLLEPLRHTLGVFRGASRGCCRCRRAGNRERDLVRLKSNGTAGGLSQALDIHVRAACDLNDGRIHSFAINDQRLTGRVLSYRGRVLRRRGRVLRCRGRVLSCRF